MTHRGVVACITCNVHSVGCVHALIPQVIVIYIGDLFGKKNHTIYLFFSNNLVVLIKR